MKKIILLALLLLPAAYGHAASTPAPQIDLPTHDGNIQLSKLRGKVVYLDFWASWCLPCKKSFPWMRRMKQQYAEQGFEILAVNLDSNRAEAQRFLDEMPVNFIVAFDEKGDSATDYELRGMPSSYLIGRDGVIYASHVGFRDKDKAQLEQAVKRLLER